MEKPLLTESDLTERVSSLVGRAVKERQLWVLFLDHEFRQLPVLIPIDETPAEPEAVLIDNLVQVLAGVLDQHAPGGSVILALERWGRTRITRSDQAWADALTLAARDGDVALTGLLLVTSESIEPLRARILR